MERYDFTVPESVDRDLAGFPCKIDEVTTEGKLILKFLCGSYTTAMPTDLLAFNPNYVEVQNW